MNYSLLFDIPPDPVSGVTAVVAIIIFVVASVTMLALVLALFLIWRKRRKGNTVFTTGLQPSSPNQS